MKPQWKPLLSTAESLITEVMEAGERQRITAGKPTDEWLNESPEERLHHVFMHLVACKTHEGTHGNPWGLTENTHLEHYKHALVGLLMVAHNLAKPEQPEGIVVDAWGYED